MKFRVIIDIDCYEAGEQDGVKHLVANEIKEFFKSALIQDVIGLSDELGTGYKCHVEVEAL